MIRIHRFFYILIIFSLVGCKLTHTISGTVSGNSKGLGGVVVTASMGARSESAVTNSKGEYTISNLDIGTYSVTASKQNFTFDPSDQSVTIALDSSSDNTTSSGDSEKEVHIHDVDFTVTAAGEEASGPNLYYFDESDETIYSDYYFEYDQDGNIESISRDKRKDGTIDSVDYYSYNQYGLLEYIDRDIDGDRETDIIYSFGYEELEAAESNLSEIKATISELEFNIAKMKKYYSDSTQLMGQINSAADLSETVTLLAGVGDAATAIADIAETSANVAVKKAEATVETANTEKNIEDLVAAEETLAEAEANLAVVQAAKSVAQSAQNVTGLYDLESAAISANASLTLAQKESDDLALALEKLIAGDDGNKAVQLAAVAEYEAAQALALASKAVTEAEEAFNSASSDAMNLSFLQSEIEKAKSEETEARNTYDTLQAELTALVGDDLVKQDISRTAVAFYDASIALETAMTEAQSAQQKFDAGVNAATANARIAQSSALGLIENEEGLLSTNENAIVASEQAIRDIVGKSTGQRADVYASVSQSSVYSYDSNGQLISEEFDVDGDSTADSSVHYSYDSQGKMVNAEFNDDEDNIIDGASNYIYDEFGRVEAVERDDNGDGEAESIYTFQYDANDNISQVSRDDKGDSIVDAVTMYSYDADDRLVTIKQDQTYPKVIGNNITFFNIEMY